MPQPQNSTRPQSQSNAEAVPPSNLIPNGEEKIKQSASRLSLVVNEAIANETAKAFEEQAEFIEQIGRTSGAHAVERIVTGITAGLEPIIRQHVAEHLPAVVAQQADSLREMARALRTAAG
jgi:hypothetical protein